MSLSIAPMIGWTDRNFRFLFRQIAREPLLYSEMVMDKTLFYQHQQEQQQQQLGEEGAGGLVHYLGHDEVEAPLALQLGGRDPEMLGRAVEVAEGFGNFAEINLNNGCPSNKAKKAGFGAELMLEPELVRQILHTMTRRASRTEVTVKCRIGIQGRKETWDDLVRYVEACKSAGCRKIIVHSRVCVLSGLTAAQNRSIPPLRYDATYRLVDHFPELSFVLNGGVKSLLEVDEHMTGSVLSLRKEKSGLKYGDEPPLGIFSSPLESGFLPLWSVSLRERIQSAGINFQNKTVKSGRYYYKSFGVAAESPAPDTGSNDSVDSLLCYDDTYPHQPALAGVMIGREAYNNPWSLANADRHFYNKPNPSLSRREVLQSYCDYTRKAQDNDNPKTSAAILCKPLHNFFHGCRTNKLFKQKFDKLIKINIEKSEGKVKRSLMKKCSGHGDYIESIENKVRIEDIVMEAIDGTIPDSFLDMRMNQEGEWEHC